MSWSTQSGAIGGKGSLRIPFHSLSNCGGAADIFIVNDVFGPDLLERLETASWNVWKKVRSGEVDVAGMGPDERAQAGAGQALPVAGR